MKTTVIPAQITTVEDKIAGNFNLTQILILMVPVFFTTVVYTILPPRLHLVWYKLPLVILVLIICLTLSLRIKGKVVLNWLIVLLKFNLRAKYYVFNKNDSYLRQIELPVSEKQLKRVSSQVVENKAAIKPNSSYGITELVRLENLIQTGKLALKFQTSKKGGLNVAFEQIQK